MKTILASILVLLACAPAWAQGGETEIHAEYSATFDRLAPSPRSGITYSHSFDVTLSGDNSVSESADRRSGRAIDNFNRRRVLGQSGSDGSHLEWRVVGPHKLQRVSNHRQSISRMTITVEGNRCRFDVSYSLKPGYREFIFPMIGSDTMGKYTRPRVTSTTCSIRYRLM
jgi:hypothetical protein